MRSRSKGLDAERPWRITITHLQPMESRATHTRSGPKPPRSGEAKSTPILCTLLVTPQSVPDRICLESEGCARAARPTGNVLYSADQCVLCVAHQLTERPSLVHPAEHPPALTRPVRTIPTHSRARCGRRCRAVLAHQGKREACRTRRHGRPDRNSLHNLRVQCATHRRAADPIAKDLHDAGRHQGRLASLRDDLRPPLTPTTAAQEGWLSGRRLSLAGDECGDE